MDADTDARLRDLTRRVEELETAWHAEQMERRQALLMQVATLERCLDICPTTATLRKQARQQP